MCNSALANRTHQTRVGWSLSAVIDMLSGVVQGSGLGPVLFLIFTARCTLVQSAVLPSYVVSLSVCLSVCL